MNRSARLPKNLFGGQAGKSGEKSLILFRFLPALRDFAPFDQPATT
ncbi:MAG: hypothetical protein KJ666_12895 [Bacteroidetes bacterium]|nr:hypothetical protein [Bacteroidota bacterium]MBU2585280.1 hypothetical protein [Bacteroidota bacterium]